MNIQQFIERNHNGYDFPYLSGMNYRHVRNYESNRIVEQRILELERLLNNKMYY